MSGKPQPRATEPPSPMVGAKWIPLTQNQFALVDESDYDSLIQSSWIAHRARPNATYYAIRAGDIDQNGKRPIIRMHRILLPEAESVDHINSNGLDNRRSNLRSVSLTEQSQHRRKFSGCVSQFKGVTWHRGQKKWNARIRVNKALIHLGSFSIELEAAKAYDRAALKHFGKFAIINFPEEPQCST